MHYIVHTDGGARGNPGPAAIGVVIVGPGHFVVELAKRIGSATNNVAEYTAVITALEWIGEHEGLLKKLPFQFYIDSELVVNQLNGFYKVKNLRIKELFRRVTLLKKQIVFPISFHSVPRSENFRADFLVNKALDEENIQ